MPDIREGAIGDLYRYSGLGLQFAATVGVFALAGWWLDGRLGASPWFLIAGVFLGFALGLYSMLKKLPSSPATSGPRRTAPRGAPDEGDTPPPR